VYRYSSSRLMLAQLWAQCFFSFSIEYPCAMESFLVYGQIRRGLRVPRPEIRAGYAKGSLLCEERRWAARLWNDPPRLCGEARPVLRGPSFERFAATKSLVTHAGRVIQKLSELSSAARQSPQNNPEQLRWN